MSQKDRTERLLNLLFALMASARPVPKHVLREAIDAYRESPSDEAFERMFERDKDELRSMGVPVETVEGSDGVGGIEGYRVAADDYALPAVDFTADELAVLGLAARVWEQASLGPAAQRALRKLETAGAGAVVDGPVGIETRIGTAEPAFPVLLEALRTRRRVRFAYRKPEDAEPAPREVEPYGVASRRGHWYLIGRDTGRGAERVFRLSRVVGTASLVGPAGAYEIPEGVDLAGSIAASPAGRVGALTARLRVAPGRGNGLRRRAISVDPAEGTDVVVLTYSDDEALASELVGLGAAVTVLEPPTLRAAVVRRLRVAAGLTAGGAA
ncbi:MAG: WYL domain-containing protein [Frankiales bacterium]|nr:WYL domain-containing protein [Frankiales bacterium]